MERCAVPRCEVRRVVDRVSRSPSSSRGDTATEPHVRVSCATVAPPLPESGVCRVARRLVLVACLACTAARPSAREHAQFTSTTHVVPVYATVTDARGELVADLTAADFQVEDNGARQAISIFKHDIQPITIAILVDASPSLFPAAGQTA